MLFSRKGTKLRAFYPCNYSSAKHDLHQAVVECKWLQDCLSAIVWVGTGRLGNLTVQQVLGICHDKETPLEPNHRTIVSLQGAFQQLDPKHLSHITSMNIEMTLYTTIQCTLSGTTCGDGTIMIYHVLSTALGQH